MKITRILSASVLAGAVLLSTTACSVSDMFSETGSSTASATASAPASPEPSESSQAEETTDTVSEQEAVAEVVNGYYTYVLMKGNLADIQAAGEPLDGKATVTDEELTTLINSLPEGFQYFDVSSPELIRNAYGQLLAGGSVGEVAKGVVEIVTPADAVTVDGDRATVNTTLASVTRDGEELNTTQDPYAADLLNLKKNDSGSWVMVAEAPKGKSSSETAAPEDSSSPEATGTNS